MPGSIDFDEMKQREELLKSRNIQKLEQKGEVKFNEVKSLNTSRGYAQRIKDVAVTIICGVAIVMGLLVLNSFMN